MNTNTKKYNVDKSKVIGISVTIVGIKERSKTMTNSRNLSDKGHQITYYIANSDFTFYKEEIIFHNRSELRVDEEANKMLRLEACTLLYTLLYIRKIEMKCLEKLRNLVPEKVKNN